MCAVISCDFIDVHRFIHHTHRHTHTQTHRLFAVGQVPFHAFEIPDDSVPGGIRKEVLSDAVYLKGYGWKCSLATNAPLYTRRLSFWCEFGPVDPIREQMLE